MFLKLCVTIILGYGEVRGLIEAPFEFLDGEDYRVTEERFLGIQYVRRLDYFDRDTKAMLIFSHTGHGEYKLQLDADPTDRTFSLRGIISRFYSKGFFIRSHRGSDLSRVIMSKLLV